MIVDFRLARFASGRPQRLGGFSAVVALWIGASMGSAEAADVGAPATKAFVAKDAVIVVQLQETVSSYDASPGEALKLIVIKNAVSNGMLIAKAGDDVEGKIVGAVQGKSDRVEQRGGDLKFAISAVHNYCGDPIAVHFTRSEYRNPNESAFLSKRDVTIDKGQEYAALVAYPQKVCATPTNEVTPTPGPDVIFSKE